MIHSVIWNIEQYRAISRINVKRKATINSVLFTVLFKMSSILGNYSYTTVSAVFFFHKWFSTFWGAPESFKLNGC